MMSRSKVGLGLFLAALTLARCERAPDGGLATTGETTSTGRLDLVIRNGRVLDPESGLDGLRYLGIGGGKIRVVSEEPIEIEGPDVPRIDASGLVVAPGFIDLHVHRESELTYRLKAQDGVTAVFELEVGTADVDAWYDAHPEGELVHYGVSIGHVPVRMEVMKDPGDFLPSGDAASRSAFDAEIELMELQIEEGLERGAVAVGMGRAYTPGASHWEVLSVFQLAARYRAPVHVHIASGEDRARALAEVLGAASLTGAPLHIVHLNSSGGSRTPQLLSMVSRAQSRGLDVTTECYPYTAGMTHIETALFDDWREWPEERFASYQWVATGERLTRDSFAAYREEGGEVITHSNTEEMVEAAVASPVAMIASDGFLVEGRGHPRSAGTYARVLGRYVRERGSLTLMEAIRKMTLAPARRLEKRVPAMADKGRIRVGADADLVVFDPARVRDRATYEEPTVPSEGILHVLVAGVPVVSDGAVVDGVRPGRAIRAPQP